MSEKIKPRFDDEIERGIFNKWVEMILSEDLNLLVRTGLAWVTIGHGSVFPDISNDMQVYLSDNNLD